MKPIKFRVRDTITNDVVGFEELVEGSIWIFTDFSSVSMEGWQRGVINRIQCHREEYTGLKAKNKEVYDGDIIQSKHVCSSGDCTSHDVYDLFRVYWDDGLGRWGIVEVDTGEHLSLFDSGNDFEVVGNVWENGDLLSTPSEPRKESEE